MRQYQAVKSKYPHSMVFFRLGDFYEMFNEDAKKASAVLGLALTARHGVPMCGVPYHSSSSYIARLLKAGHKVAICEQIAEDGKGLFKREVVRLITPGTVVEDELLDARSSNHLVALEVDIVGWGLAAVDISTGEFWGTQKIGDNSFRMLAAMLSRINPAEVLVSPKGAELLGENFDMPSGSSITPWDAQVELSVPQGWPGAEIWRNRQLALKAALKASKYVGENTPNLKDLLSPVYREPVTSMQLDENAVRTLELVSSQFGGREQTLWGVLDNTVTPMGSRLLREWVLSPLLELTDIKARLNAVSELYDNAQGRSSLAEILSGIADVDRSLSRIAARTASPRDAAALRKSLEAAAPLRQWIEGEAAVLPRLRTRFEDAQAAIHEAGALLARAIADNPPARLSDGGVIRDGFHPELDELRGLKRNSREKLAELEERERQATQISSLKVSYNSVFGYYIEVTKSNIAKVPPGYVRKQTLANSERFITQELKEMESKILGAEDRIARIESHLFEEVRQSLLGYLSALRVFARTAAELDAYYSLAEAAIKGGYVRPEVDLSHDLHVEGGRHPVAERNLPAGQFVPNGLRVSSTDPQIMVITGPNMSGKSVYLKQNALIAVMAQMGSFVPAQSVRMGVIDRIMTRMGAHDALARNESTFMVEMREASAILSTATPRSLVLLDEIGRGTSTFDGVSIAWAMLEYLYRKEGGPKVLFATHYFELTELEDKYKGIRNFNVEVREWQNKAGKTELVFLHKIGEGPADKSYGIHVAELAGLPPTCVLRARAILKNLEERTDPTSGRTEQPPLLPIFGADQIIEELKLCSPEKMTPLEALNAITEWKKRLG